jgi:FkbM family methyltransferase
MIRSLLERMSRGRVLKRRLPAAFGGLPLLVSPDASLRYWRHDLGRVDPVLLRTAKRMVGAGDVVWDIGANVGLFSFAAAGLAGRTGKVLALEPDPWLAQLLRASASLAENRVYRVEVLSAAAGERLATAVLNIAQRGRATNFVSGAVPSTQTGGVRGMAQVVCVTLDWLLDFWPAPALVKVDVEGAELAVLRGAQRMLREIRPRFACEVSSANREAATAIFRAAGYILYDAESAAPGPAEIPQCAWNTIAVPAGSGGPPEPA